jgi:hypothetical protein
LEDTAELLPMQLQHGAIAELSLPSMRRNRWAQFGNGEALGVFGTDAQPTRFRLH